MNHSFANACRRSPAIRFALALALILALVWPAPVGRAAGLHLVLPLQRTAWQDNEWIHFAVVRRSPEPLAAGDLRVHLDGADGSRLEFVFPLEGAAVAGGRAMAVEHVHVNGQMLRPGRYAVEAAADGATAGTNIEVYSHLRRSSFKLINWGRAQGAEQLAQGEENLGFNLFYGHYSGDDQGQLIRAGVDFMACCVMSGGHQMDLRSECDWSDPYVIRGGTRRVVQQAFRDRTRPNVLGVHFYDEPGLTWVVDPATGERTPHAVPWQLRQYEAARGKPAMSYRTLDPAAPADAVAWADWARWKLGLMDAAWQDAQFGVGRVRPDYVSATQSQYGYSAFTDGYYFNVARSLPVVSGHGGYHDFGPGYFNPAMFLEFARARDLARPNWYLPTWYASTSADEFRLEQYLAFQCNLQGMISPPDLDPRGEPDGCRAIQGMVEANHRMARLGTVFTTLPVTRPPVALLYSLSQFIHAQTLDRKVAYAHDTPHGRNVMFTYLAGKRLQHQFMPLLDEEVLDGTLAAHHQAVILTSIDYLHPPVVGALEQFAQAGGIVLLTADCQLRVNGAVKLKVAPGWPDAGRIAELQQAGHGAEANGLMRLRQALVAADQCATALRPHLESAGIHPPLSSSEPGVVVTRHAAGDVEYLFAVNAAHDPAGDPMLGIKAVTAELALHDFSRAPFVYDAVHGGLVADFATGAGAGRAAFRFGPGQMRVFARLRRAVGGVTVGTPELRRDLAASETPLGVRFTVSVYGQPSGSSGSGAPEMISGSIPLRIVLTDPLGATRYDLYRATAGGVLQLTLPLALNDPAGEWTVTVTELLAHTVGTASFELPAAHTGSAMAGLTRRAVHWPDDRKHIFRFFREQSRATLVTGSAPYHQAAAARLARSLEPWNVRCEITTAAQSAQPRLLSETEAATWIGLDYAAHGQIQPGRQNPIAQAGVAVTGPVILLGSPADHPLVQFLAERRFLPFPPDAEHLPGPRRGYVAWQRDALGPGQESIALIAYDEAGLSEAVGTMYEFAAGLEPLTRLVPPRRSILRPATSAGVRPELFTRWTTVVPDRVIAMTRIGDGLAILTHDGTLSELALDGRIRHSRVPASAERERLVMQWQRPPDPAALLEARKAVPTTRLVKLVEARGASRAVACWGGSLLVFAQGQLAGERRLPQDITALLWAGDLLIAGDADGRVIALAPPTGPRG